MTTLLGALHGAETVLLAAARIWAVAGELLTAAALLWALDALARLIRATYWAGYHLGRILWPVLHALAAAGRWLWAHIDWAEVAATVRAGLAVLVAAAVTGAQLAIPALCAASERLGRSYSRLLVGTTTPQQPATEPKQALQAPVAVTKPTATTRSRKAAKAPQRPLQAPQSPLQSLTVRELRQLARKAGHKALARSWRKADLLAALAA